MYWGINIIVKRLIYSIVYENSDFEYGKKL